MDCDGGKWFDGSALTPPLVLLHFLAEMRGIIEDDVHQAAHLAHSECALRGMRRELNDSAGDG